MTGVKYLAPVATLLGLLAIPALAQHGAARGGFSSHGGTAPHGFSAPAPHFSGGFSGGVAQHGPVGLRPGSFGTRGPVALRPGAPRFSQGPGTMRFGGSRFAGSRGRMTGTPYRRFGTAADHTHNPYHPGDHDGHHHHRMVYWNGGVYPYGYFYPGYPILTGYVDPWLFGPDDYDANEHQSAATADAYDPDYPQVPYAHGQYPQDQDSSSGYAPEQRAQQDTQHPLPGAGRQPYTGSTQGATAPNLAGSAGEPGRAPLTVIFTDGRPAERFHNYLLTADTLTVFEPHYRQIPLNQVNLSATEAANQAAGVEFRPPGQ